MSAAFDHVTLGQRVLFGTGSAVENAVRAIRDLGSQRVLLIHGRSSVDVAELLAARLNVVARIDRVSQHVPVEDANAAVAAASAARADLILTIGGGSATGLGKAVALRTGAPVVAVPTTFAGSEATDVWGITESGRKKTGSDTRVLPRVVVYDAELSAGLDTRFAIASGLNAVAHAVDGFWAPRADPINRALGTEGLRALVPGLRGLVADPTDLESRERTIYGAYLAAVAFSSAGSGLHHKICHTLGGAYGLPHAEMHAIVLPYVAAFNQSAAGDAAARVRSILGGDDAAVGLAALNAELGAPRSLAEIGLRQGDIEEAAGLVLSAVPPSNPRPVVLADLVAIIRAAWSGDPIV